MHASGAETALGAAAGTEPVLRVMQRKEKRSSRKEWSLNYCGSTE